MALETIESTPPPFFRQGLPALVIFILLSGLSVLLMVADQRMQFSAPLRSGIATALTPLQWLSRQPGRAMDAIGQYISDAQLAQDTVEQYQSRTIAQAQQLQLIEQLQLENRQLRDLLGLRGTVQRPSQAAQILYDTSDDYTERLVIDKGALAGIQGGSVVIDAAGVVGQVTRVYPLVSEVTRVTDRDQSTPVMNARTGDRHVAFGDTEHVGELLELRFVPASTDIRQGDLLVTSGIDGVYPAGLHVGQVLSVDRRINSSFARVLARPVVRAQGRHLLVLKNQPDDTARAAEDAAKQGGPR